jgi:exonuclease VII small subunit
MTKEQIKQLEADILQSNQGQLDSEEVSGTFEMALVIIKELQEELRQKDKLLEMSVSRNPYKEFGPK